MIDARIDSLTPRERDCLRLVLTTDSHKHIGRTLGISHHTVETHLKRANRKLGVGNSARAAQLLQAYEAGTEDTQSWGHGSAALPPEREAILEIVPAAAQRPMFGLLRRWLRLPALRANGGGNDLTARQRLGESFQAMFIAIASIGVLVAALTGLGILAHTWIFDR